jgi:hypothetical protein
MGDREVCIGDESPAAIGNAQPGSRSSERWTRHARDRAPTPHDARQTGRHLSQAGVDLAWRLGETMEPYELVVTSPVARAFETAIAMGFAEDEQ